MMADHPSSFAEWIRSIFFLPDRRSSSSSVWDILLQLAKFVDGDRLQNSYQQSAACERYSANQFFACANIPMVHHQRHNRGRLGPKLPPNCDDEVDAEHEHQCIDSG